MKTLKINTNKININEFAEQVSSHFRGKYAVTDNNKNEITIAESTTIGCRIILTKKKLLVNGAFPTVGAQIVAVTILLLGGIIIPMTIYMVAYKKKFVAIENEVSQYLKVEFAIDKI